VEIALQNLLPDTRKMVHKTFFKQNLPKKVKRKPDIKGLFERVWASREHKCSICGSPVLQPLTFCFSHNLSKATFKKYAECDSNISIVCSMECHHENDKKRAYRLAEIIEANEKWLAENKLI
jgi:hypothetical protein